MKKEFIGFYDPTQKEIKEAWEKGVFAFDANTLLNLYRYTELTRKDFLSALRTIKNKLFLPHQAAFEYHANRISVIESINNSYNTLTNIIKENLENNLKNQINQFKKHPSIIVDNIFKLYTEFTSKVSKELENQKKKHPNFQTSDEVLNELTELFDSRIGKEFSKEDLKKIYLEGKERYTESVPPGFKDLENKRKKGEKHVYGDLIIWKELINYSKTEKNRLIFVTDDRKEDWWTIENGKTIRPREELIKEFYDQTEVRILIYNADNFLHYAKEHQFVPHLKDNTIKEVKEIRISDEKNNLAYIDLAKATAYTLNYGTQLNDLVKATRDSYRTHLIDLGSTAKYAYGTQLNDLANYATLYGSQLNDLVTSANAAFLRSTIPITSNAMQKSDDETKIINSNSTIKSTRSDSANDSKINDDNKK